MERALNNRAQALLYIIAGIVLILSLNLLALPVLIKNRELNTSIDAEKAKFVRYHRLLKHAQQIREAYQKLPSYSAAAAENHADSLVATLTEIEGLAKSININILEIRPESESRDAGKAAFMLRTQANIESYFKFLYSLENYSSLLNVDKLTLTSKSSSPELEGSFYFSQSGPAR